MKPGELQELFDKHGIEVMIIEFFSETLERYTREVILMRETYDHQISLRPKSEFEKRQEWLDSLRKRHQRRSRK
jgi:hypothetical protein